MRAFRFFDRRKKLPIPASSSSVHPSANGWADGHCPNRTKVMELLGVVSQKECLEIDGLLNITCWQGDSSSGTDYDDMLSKICWQGDSSSGTDDDEPTEVDSIEEDGTVWSQENQKTTPDLPKSRCCVDLATENAVQGPPTSTPRTVWSQKTGPDLPKSRCCVEENAVQGPPTSSPQFEFSSPRPRMESVTPRLRHVDMKEKANSAQGLAITHQHPKLLKLQCVPDRDMVLNSTYGLANTSQRTNSVSQSQNSSSRSKHSASYEETFRLPPEKHYLPSPQAHSSKEVHSIAHPLPHPRPSIRSPSNQHVPGRKVDIACRRTVSCARAPPQQATSSHCSMVNSRMPGKTPQNSPPETPPRWLYPQSFAHRSLSQPSSTTQSPRFSHISSQSPLHLSSWLVPITNSPPRSPAPNALCPHKWTKGAILGQGTFGTVHEGWNLEDGSFFAVKVSSREDVSPEIQQEVDVLSKLEHPNIVRYFGSSIEHGRLCIFLELVRMGSLDSILQKYKRFEDNTIRIYTRQILLGLEYLHAKKTIHRDIKSANILVDVNGQVKLSDFGVAKQVDEFLASSVKGTPLYMAPEVLTPGKNCYSFPADIWSLGCTVFEMADGKPPWSNLQGFGFFFKVKSGELPPIPEHLSSEGKDFIRRCLKLCPKDRSTAVELLQHPFVVNVSTPEAFIPRSPPSPVSLIPWPPSSPPSSTTWACGNCSLSSPSNTSCFDQVLAGAQRAQTLLHG